MKMCSGCGCCPVYGDETRCLWCCDQVPCPNVGRARRIEPAVITAVVNRLVGWDLIWHNFERWKKQQREQQECWELE